MSNTQGGPLEFEYDIKLEKFETKLNRIESQLAGVTNTAVKQSSLIDKAWGMALASAAAYFTGQFVGNIIKGSIMMNAEFEKMGAVLENTLGSKGKAQEALQLIKDFARETPFQVTELTEAFIKLSNRGIVPTGDELRSIGDFAATSGKSFEQLTEAILDANNSERWKEFGVKVETIGNKVKLSFKDQTVEVERSAEGAVKAVQAFSQLQGVQGSMAAIMKTTKGELSNFEDGVDALKDAIGQRLSGATKGMIHNAQALVKVLTSWFDIPLSDKIAEEQIELNKLVIQLQDTNTSEEERKKIIEELQKNYPDFLKNIDIEKASNEDLATALNIVNEEYINKIILARTEAELQKEIDKGDRIRNKKLTEQGNLLQTMADLTVFINQKSKEGFQVDQQLLDSAKTNQERVNALVTIIDDLQSQGVDITGFQEPIDALQKGISLLDVKLKKQESITEQVKKQRDEMKAMLGMDKPANKKPAKNEKIDPEEALKDFIKNLKEQKKAYEQYEDAKVTYGVEAAKAMYPKLLDSYKSYLLQLREKYKDNPTFAGAVSSELAPIFNEEHLEELPRIEDFWEKQKSANTTELKLTRTVTAEQARKLKLIQEQVNAGGEFNLTMLQTSALFSGMSNILSGFDENLSNIASSIANASYSMAVLNNSEASASDKISANMSLFSATIEAFGTIFQGVGNGDSILTELAQSYELFQELLRVQIDLIDDLVGTEKIIETTKLLSELDATIDSILHKEQYWALGGPDTTLFDIIGGDDLSDPETMKKLVAYRAELEKLLEWAESHGKTARFVSFYKDRISEVDTVIDSYETRQDRLNKFYEDLTGSSVDSIVDSISDGFQNGLSSVVDFADKTEDIIRKALIRSFETKFLESQLQAWYNSFGEDVLSGGELTEEEAARNKKLLEAIIANSSIAFEAYQKMMDDLGFGGADAQSTLSGSIKGIQEDTANVLAGQVNAMRIIEIRQAEIMESSLSVLTRIEYNTSFTRYVVDELKAIKGKMGTGDSLINNRANGR